MKNSGHEMREAAAVGCSASLDWSNPRHAAFLSEFGPELAERIRNTYREYAPGEFGPKVAPTLSKCGYYVIRFIARPIQQLGEFLERHGFARTAKYPFGFVYIFRRYLVHRFYVSNALTQPRRTVG